MDVIQQLGELALGSRLKRLSDRIMKQGTEIYKKYNIDFEPKWFPVYYTLSLGKQNTVMEIAKEIGITHPSVSQIVKELTKKGYISTKPHAQDKRAKVLALSKKGASLLPKMKPIWEDISQAIHDINVQHTNNILGSLTDFEADLNEKGLDARVDEIINARLLSEVEIIEFEPKYADNFKQLNIEWITQYFKLEDEDINIINNPYDTIINKGGCILLAKYHDQIVGTCSLLKVDNEHFELVKMAVTPRCKGKKIGKKLGLATVQKAKEIGAKKITLETNKTLTPAINLYHKLGFKMRNDRGCDSLYQRCDVQMELVL